MVDEEKEIKEDEEAKPQAAEAGSKSSMKKMIGVGVAVLFLAGAGYATWNFLRAGKVDSSAPPQEGIKEEAAKTGSGEMGETYEMESFIVNLTGREGKRYLKATLELEFQANEYIKEQLDKRSPQLRDAIIMLLSGKTFEDISAPDGKLRLKNELIIRINQSLPPPGVSALYFTEFVIQ